MKKLLFSLALLIFLTGCQSKSAIQKNVDALTGIGTIETGQAAVKNLAIAQAKEVYNQQKALDTDFSNGPCIAEHLMDDWVADIAHNPRQEVDNLPTNQCQSFIQGQTHHFVELDPEGNLIREQ